MATQTTRLAVVSLKRIPLLHEKMLSKATRLFSFNNNNIQKKDTLNIQDIMCHYFFFIFTFKIAEKGEHVFNSLKEMLFKNVVFDLIALYICRS